MILKEKKTSEEFVDSNLYILSKKIVSPRRCPVPGCYGNGNISPKHKTHFTKNSCPNYEYFMKNNAALNSVVELSDDIDTFEFNNFKESFNQKEIQFKNSLENFERLNGDLKAKLDEKTNHSNQQYEIYKKYKVTLFVKIFFNPLEPGHL